MSTWVKTRVLGAGSYGTVYLATNPCSELLPRLAIKSADLSKASSLMQEKILLHHLKGCPEIIQCYGDDFTVEKGYQFVYNLGLEFAPGGTLTDLIINNYGGKLAEANVQSYARMLLKGLDHIHRKGYVHCDLKPDNILVFPSRYGTYLKIADFGLSKRAGERLIYQVDGKPRHRGTPLYASPESVIYGTHEAPLDIWSLGCVVIEMFTGKFAWNCKDMRSLIHDIALGKGPKIPSGMSVNGIDFLKKCFVRDPMKRWTAKMLLNHPFIVEDCRSPSLNSFTFSHCISEEQSSLWSKSMDNLFEEAKKVKMLRGH